MNKTYVVGNWKMNGSLELVNELNMLKFNPNVKIVVCPPYPYLGICNQKDKVYSLGAQNCYQSLSGAYTGEVSVDHLMETGCEYVVLGHSERRTMCYETDSVVNSKAKTALSVGLTPIICVGEPLATRQSGGFYKKYILDQLEGSLAGLDLESVIVAYEPIWAIGTGVIPTNNEIEEVVQLIKSTFKNIRVLYGGSVKPENVGVLNKIDSLDGFLVGGASLDIDKFQHIIDKS